jgi:hypothetical protein
MFSPKSRFGGAPLARIQSNTGHHRRACADTDIKINPRCDANRLIASPAPSCGLSPREIAEACYKTAMGYFTKTLAANSEFKKTYHDNIGVIFHQISNPKKTRVL